MEKDIIYPEILWSYPPFIGRFHGCPLPVLLHSSGSRFAWCRVSFGSTPLAPLDP